MSEFDFRDTPEEFNFYCVDRRGNQLISQKRPTRLPLSWVFPPVSEHDKGFRYIQGIVDPSNWENSLQQRPITVEWLRGLGFESRDEHYWYEPIPGTEILIIPSIFPFKYGVMVTQFRSGVELTMPPGEQLTRERILNLLNFFQPKTTIKK